MTSGEHVEVPVPDERHGLERLQGFFGAAHGDQLALAPSGKRRSEDRGEESVEAQAGEDRPSDLERLRRDDRQAMATGKGFEYVGHSRDDSGLRGGDQLVFG